MRISRVRLKNFRQFYGTQELEFPLEGKRNVTLIHAENGFGKTSILNAVLWCFYRQTTPKFEKPNDIVNYDALEERVKSATVDVEISFKKARYLVQRVFEETKDARDKTCLNAFKVETGSLKPLTTPETFVASVIPPEIAKYFFFDGEAAESFAAARNFKEVGNAVRSILGCSLADTAIGDLKDVLKHVDREIGDVADDSRISDLETEMAAKTMELETAYKLRESILDDLATLKEQHEEIVQSLRDAAGAQEIQKQRDDKLALKERVEQESAECRQEILKWIGQRGIQVVSKRLSQVTLNFVDEASLRGKIPSPYNEDFVRGLLGSGTCICHRPIATGTPEWVAVADLLKTASNAEVLSRVVRARARSQMLREECASAPKALATLQTKLAGLLDRHMKLEQQIAELGKKIEGLPLKELAERERSRRAVDHKIQKKQEDLGGTKAHIARLELEKGGIEREIDELARKNAKTVRLHAKRRLVQRSLDLLAALLARYESDARKRIEDDVNDILEVVAHKDFRCSFDENFALEMILNNRTTPKSGGENQLLSLAFIASLVKFSADRIDSKDLVLRPGTVAPLVLDAPLGQLDPTYQASVAEFLPKLAEQVVLLVSGSQGVERVLTALEPYVGAEYLLIQENKGPQGKRRQLPRRVIRGRAYDLVLFGQPHTMTRIERLM